MAGSAASFRLEWPQAQTSAPSTFKRRRSVPLQVMEPARIDEAN
jgi:hypothetical protein